MLRPGEGKLLGLEEHVHPRLNISRAGWRCGAKAAHRRLVSVISMQICPLTFFTSPMAPWFTSWRTLQQQKACQHRRRRCVILPRQG